MKRARLLLGLSALVLAALAPAPPAAATPPLQGRARAAGFPATDCTYCHAFTMDHMTRKALEMKIPPMNCYACHGNRLPRTGKALFNARGQWLIQARRSRKADQIDVAWLKDYVPPPSPAAPRP